MMFAEERRAAIAEILKGGNSVYVAELCKEFGVSEATIRRDLAVLERMRLLKRTHGGAVPPTFGLESSFEEKRVQNLDLLHEMVKRKAKLGLAAICIAGGQGMATIYENLML